jgi:hypothetical protein
MPSMRAMPPMAVMWPVQNCCHVPGSVVAGSQVLRYGPRTASGAAGGLMGLAARFPVAAAGPGDGATARAVAAAALAGARMPVPAMAPAIPPAAATPPE